MSEIPEFNSWAHQGREVEDLCAALAAKGTGETPAAGGGIESKAELFRGFLLRRICDCARAAILLEESDRRLPALILVRAAAETTIMLCGLFQKSSEFATTKNKEAFDRFLTTGALGAGDATTLEQACTFLMLVEELDKERKGFKKEFTRLCDVTDARYDVALRTSGPAGRVGVTAHGEKLPLGHAASSPGALLVMMCLDLAKVFNEKTVQVIAAIRCGFQSEEHAGAVTQTLKRTKRGVQP